MHLQASIAPRPPMHMPAHLQGSLPAAHLQRAERPPRAFGADGAERHVAAAAGVFKAAVEVNARIVPTASTGARQRPEAQQQRQGTQARAPQCPRQSLLVARLAHAVNAIA